MSESNSQTNLESERQKILKDLYLEVGTNFRHFLTWRQLLFAGYFPVIGGLSALFEWKTSNSSADGKYIILLCIAIIVTIVFWLLDSRNRQLIRNVSDAGEKIEKELGVQGSYSIYKEEEHSLTHSGILKLFYSLAIIAYSISLLVLFSKS